jgi:hypothetical protein
VPNVTVPRRLPLAIAVGLLACGGAGRAPTTTRPAPPDDTSNGPPHDSTPPTGSVRRDAGPVVVAPAPTPDAAVTTAAVDAGGRADGGGTARATADAAPDAAAVTTPAGPPPKPASGGAWWDAAWRLRRSLAVDNRGLAEPLTDFPVLVKLAPDALAVGDAKPAGEDLRFVDAAGKPLPHEIERWDPSGGSVVWVRLPRIDPAPAAVSFWMYYGNPAAAAPAADVARAVWAPPFSGVWHLADNTADATPNAFDGVKMTGGRFVAGPVGHGVELRRAMKQHIMFKPNSSFMNRESAITISAWVKPEALSSDGSLIVTFGKWFTDNHNSYADLQVNADGSLVSHIDPGTNTSLGGYATVHSTTAPFTPGANSKWSWAAAVIDLTAGTETFFMDGKPIGDPVKAKFSARTFIDMPSSRAGIGTEEDECCHDWDGLIDEVRVERGARSPAWLAAAWRTMADDKFLVWGAPEKAK